MTNVAARIAENLAEIRGKIAAATMRSGRKPSDVTLVAVTKFIHADIVRLLVESGCNDLGESRPQELWEKSAALADLPVRWHMIGHLQRNKVRRTLPILSMIHSIDTPRLAAEIDEEMPNVPGRPNTQIPILLEVNISGEISKHGFAPEEVEPFLAELPKYSSLKPVGLMCMAALEGGPELARRDFAALRQLRDRLQPNCPPGVTLDQLSMGMSGDFESAIEEGATLVRVGSALFEGI